MENQIQKFDPSTLMQGVKDRIKATFVSLIPDEQWDQMVQKEISDFFEWKPSRDQWGNYHPPARTDFANLVHSLLEQEAKSRIGDFLKTDQFNVIWQENGQPVVSEEVNKMIVDNMAAVFQQLMIRPVVETLNVMQSQMNPNNHYS